MKKLSYAQFSKRLKIISSRADRFTWKPEHVQDHGNRQKRFSSDGDEFEHHGSKKVDEKTYDAPQHHNDWDDDHPRHDHVEKKHLDQFENHGHDIEHEHYERRGHKHEDDDAPTHLESIKHYKGDGYETINHALRHKEHHELSDRNKHHVKNLDHVTSHRTEHDMHVFRGVPHHAQKFHEMEPGHEFTDHAYTSTSHKHGTARSFTGPHPSSRRHVFKIHLPAGTKAHHFDHHENVNDHEGEVVLHRGTRFRVTHHSRSDDTHYIHATVVHQESHHD